MKIFKFAICSLMVFMSGMVFCASLSQISPDYPDAIMSSFLGVFFALSAREVTK